MRYKRK